MADDVELLQRYAAEKSEAAFAELVRRHLDFVYSAALRRVGDDAHSAADVTQQVFVRLARQAPALARGVVLPAWLYAATRNLAVDLVRAEQRRRAREKEAQMRYELNMSETSAAEWERLRPLLDGAMDELGGRDREAVLLRFFARQPFGEIGRALNLSEDAARMRVERALEKLRALLGRRGVTSSAAALGLVLSSHTVMAAPASLGVSITTAALPSAAAGPIATALQFMSTAKFVTTGAAVLALFAGGAAVCEVRASREAESALALARLEKANAVARRAALEREVAQAEAAAVQRGAAAQAMATRPTAPAAAPVVNSPSPALTPDLARQHPDVRQAWIAYSRAQHLQQFRPLLRELRLTPVQIDEFMRIATWGVAQSNWPGPDGKPLTLTAGGDANQKPDALRALLGDDGYRRYVEFGGQVRAWALVEEVAGNLFATVAPLSPGQGAELARILVVHGLVSGQQIPVLDWPAVMAEAKTFLSGLQLDVLQGFHSEMEYREAYIRAMQRAVREVWPPPTKQ